MRHDIEIVLDDHDRNLVKECMEVDATGDEVLFDKEWKFDDGVRLALRIVNSRGEYKEYISHRWTEGILFSPEGAEIGLTDCDEDIYGEYVFFVDGNEYHANVK